MKDALFLSQVCSLLQAPAAVAVLWIVPNAALLGLAEPRLATVASIAAKKISNAGRGCQHRWKQLGPLTLFVATV